MARPRSNASAKEGPEPKPGAESHAPYRVVVYEAGPEADTSTLTLLSDEGFDVVSCPSGETLIEEVVQHRPDAVVYALGPDCGPDIGVLQLMRRVAPTVPLVLLATDGSLAVQRQLRDLRPIYYAILPVEPAELRDAVYAAIARTNRFAT